MPIASIAGRSYAIDGQRGDVPTAFDGKVHLTEKDARSVDLILDAGVLHLAFATPTHVMVQDNRQWTPSLVVRIGTQHGPKWPSGTAMSFDVELSTEGGLSVDKDMPVTIAQGADWAPLHVELDIEKGSALDFSRFRPTRDPIGDKGRVIATADGHFAFERAPQTPLRFYGVNLCFGAQYLEHSQADKLAERLARLGYNAVRIHHYEGQLVSPESPSTLEEVAAQGGTPDKRLDLKRFEAPTKQGDDYHAHLHGWLHPPKTGDYVFYIASDDESELHVRSGASHVDAPIARVPSWTGPEQWEKFPPQKSGPVHLVEGQAYAVDVWHHQGSGGDHLEVAWSGAGMARAIIDGKYLSKTDKGPRGSITWDLYRRKTATDSLTFNRKSIDQLDYLMHALKEWRIYVTTDLFVSRPVLAAEIWPGATGNVAMNDFKMAVPVNERAWSNWRAFAKNLLTHKNSYNGARWADDPTLAWLSMINEGTFANYFSGLDERVKRDWQAKYNVWLKRTYKNKAELAKAWGQDPGGDPAAATVPLAGNVWGDTQRDRDLVAFSAEVETEMFGKMKRFLRDEVGTKALFTNTNAWTNRIVTETSRPAYDYVDDHFYVDHPRFLEKDWQLPSRNDNTSPIAEGAPGGRNNAFVRLMDKPFTVSEYNYSSPGRFRGVGGVLTGALAALQDWSVLWRFAYSHDAKNLFTPGPMNYFDMAADPLNQAAERASIALFLRSDLKRAQHSVAIAMTPSEVLETRKSNHDMTPDWRALAWIVRVGSSVQPTAGNVPADVILPLAWKTQRSAWKGGDVLDVEPYSKDATAALWAELKKKGWLTNNRSDLDKGLLQSEGGELTIDAARDTLVLDTPRTAGGYAPQGQTIETSSATIRIDSTDATVWISSLDDQPIRDSHHLLITHLTDLQNSGARFGEQARQTLLAWGGLPHLVRTGTATASVRLTGAARAKAFALSTSGRRVAPVRVTVKDGALEVPLAVAAAEGARMLYEVAVE